MPKLGQILDTPNGAGQVISLHLLKELVTVRLELNSSEVTFACAELGLGADHGDAPSASRPVGPAADVESHRILRSETSASDEAAPSPNRKRRRRRSSRRAGADESTAN